MTDKEKQIEELSTLVYITHVLGFSAVDVAKRLYTAGYRKHVDVEVNDEE